VLDIFKPKPYCNCIEVQNSVQVCRSNNILDSNLGVLHGFNPDTVQLFRHIAYNGMYISNVFCPCTYNLDGSKDQECSFRIRNPVNEPGELLLVVLGSFELGFNNI